MAAPSTSATGQPVVQVPGFDFSPDPVALLHGKRLSYIQATGGSLGVYGEVGGTIGSTNGSTQADSVQGTSFNYISAATTNSQCGWHATNGQFVYGRRLYFKMRFRLLQLNSIILWTGFTSVAATGMNSNDPSAHFVGFRYSSSAGDTTYRFATKNNVTLELGDSGIQPTTSTQTTVEFTCDDNLGAVSFRIGGRYVGQSTANLPTIGTALRPFIVATTLADEAKDLRLMRGVFTADDDV